MTTNTNCLVDSHMIASLLVQVCEDGLFAFAKVLLEKGADVSVAHVPGAVSFELCSDC